jgi:CheY-like chemotaxis protein
LPSLALARVLLVDHDLTSRLTLQTILRAGGYWVDVAATAAEAIEKLDEDRYDLVLSDLHMESDGAGLKVLAHARMKDYKPATALVRSELEVMPAGRPSEVFVKTEGVPALLAKVADLLGDRALRRVARSLRLAAVYQTTV